MSRESKNTFGAKATLRVSGDKAGGDSVAMFKLDALERAGIGEISRLPFSLKVLLENLLRHEDGRFVHADDIRALAAWDPSSGGGRKKFRSCPRACCCRISPACRPWWIWPRCATRCAHLGGDPKKINPLLPAELVIDHSVQVDKFGAANAFAFNAETGDAAQHRALRVPALGPEELSRISRSCRRTPASATR